MLHRTLREHWPAFLERAGEAGVLPKFVTEEVEGYLRCGQPEHGCALLVCERCGKAVVVAFSCKHRGFCPSCCGRRMNDAALHLTEQVFPEVPVRQGVFTAVAAALRAGLRPRAVRGGAARVVDGAEQELPPAGQA